MTSKIFSVYWWLILLLLVSQLNCSVLAQTRQVKLGESFTLRPDETAEIEDAKLSIRLLGVGRKISESGEVEYVELQVRVDKTERLITISERKNRTARLGKYAVELINADSFGKANCELKISRKS